MTDMETEEIVEEYAGLVLEDQLLDHLATKEGCKAVWRERLSSELIGDADDGIRSALEFVIDYMDSYREPPSRAILEEETGYDEFEKPIAPIYYVIRKLKERYQRQQMKRIITQMGRAASDPEAALRLGLSELNRVQAETKERRDSMDSSEVMSTLDAYKHRVTTGAIQGVTYGYKEMDDALGGLQKDTLTFIIARPKRFKSWQLLWSAKEAVWYESRSVYFATLEMPPEEMMERYTCMLAKVSFSDWKFGNIQPTDSRLMEAGQLAFNNDNHIFFRRPPRGERTVAHLVQEAQELEAECLYIDQLSFLESTRRANDRWQEVAYICEDLKEASSIMPVYIAAQFNREAAGLNDMADLAKIGLSDAIGQTADTILGVHATKDMYANKLIHLGVIEARSYEPITWEVKIKIAQDTSFEIVNVVDKT